MATDKATMPQQLEEDIAPPKIPTNPTEPMERINDAFNEIPTESNGDNTAVDPMGNIHSGSAVPDPIGDTLEGETARESRDFIQEDILDEDPILGSPQGVANAALDQEFIDQVADENENVFDRMDERQEEGKE